MGIVLLTSIILTTIVHSAFSTQLQIGGDAIVRSDNDIRITNVMIDSQNNGAYETYNSKYTKDTTSMFVTLPSNSSITYELEIINKEYDDYILTSLMPLNTINSNIAYNYDINQNKSYKKSSINKFNITLLNNTNEEQIGTLVLQYVFTKAESTFVTGSEFNWKIKELAGTDTSGQTYRHNQYDTNINYIRRAYELPEGFEPTENNIVSTADSVTPIYTWFDNGTIYYYTLAERPYSNNSTSHMFRALGKVKSIDLSTIDTSKSGTFDSMFFWCTSLQSLNVSNFNTTNVTNMNGMFDMYQNNSALIEIIGLENFDTSKVTQMERMFKNDNKLTLLNISSFNMNKVNNTTDMLLNLESLQRLKTPKIYPNSLSITLPKMLYDESNNSYTILDNTSPTQTWLRINE